MTKRLDVNYKREQADFEKLTNILKTRQDEKFQLLQEELREYVMRRSWRGSCLSALLKLHEQGQLFKVKDFNRPIMSGDLDFEIE